eukprot:CFRG4366T1
MTNPAAIIGQKFVVGINQPVRLVFKEKMSFAGDSAKISDTNGNLWFKIKSKSTMSDKKLLSDVDGNVIAIVYEKMLSMRKRQYICMADGEKIAEVKTKSVLQTKSNAIVSFLKSDGLKNADPDLKISGSLLGHNYEIMEVESGRLLAEVRKDIDNVGSIFFGTDNFFVTVFPNVDAAFVTCIVFILKEMFADTMDFDL